MIKKIICRIFGHRYISNDEKPKYTIDRYNGYTNEWICVRCKHTYKPKFRLLWQDDR